MIDLDQVRHDVTTHILVLQNEIVPPSQPQPEIDYTVPIVIGTIAILGIILSKEQK